MGREQQLACLLVERRCPFLTHPRSGEAGAGVIRRNIGVNRLDHGNRRGDPFPGSVEQPALLQFLDHRSRRLPIRINAVARDEIAQRRPHV
ncbi:MAG: hypothetical protein ACRDJE_21555 [Dehalococcoidia bacterium]